MNTTDFSDDTVQSGTELPPFRKMSLQYFYPVDGDCTSFRKVNNSSKLHGATVQETVCLANTFIYTAQNKHAAQI